MVVFGEHLFLDGLWNTRHFLHFLLSIMRGHRGRTASCPDRPRTDPGVPFLSTGLFRSTRFRIRHQQRKTGAAIQDGSDE